MFLFISCDQMALSRDHLLAPLLNYMVVLSVAGIFVIWQLC